MRQSRPSERWSGERGATVHMNFERRLWIDCLEIG